MDNPPAGSLHFNFLFQAIKSAYRVMLSSGELDKTIVVSETNPITTQALSLDKRKFVLNDIVDVKSLPPDLQKLYFQNQDVTRELSGLHQQLKASGSDEQRKELAEKIVQLFDLRKSNWQVLDNFSAGDQENSEKESVSGQQAISAQDILVAKRRMDTLRINISRVNKELLEKELSEAKIQARQKKLLAWQNEQQELSKILGIFMKELIEKEIGEIPTAGNKYFIADGSWSLFELIGYVLDKVGPSHVFITSFSLSEESIRHLHHLKETGRILSLKGLFDPSLRKTKTPLLYFASSAFCDMKFLANHSKIILMENPERHFVILASANLGRNRRIETRILDADPVSFKFLKYKLSEIFDSAIPL